MGPTGASTATQTTSDSVKRVEVIEGKQAMNPAFPVLFPLMDEVSVVGRYGIFPWLWDH